MIYFINGHVRPWLLVLALAATGRADIAVNFSLADPGTTKSIPSWGLDTNWASSDNMTRGLTFMSPALVNVVRLPGMVDKALDAGLTSDEKAHLQQCMALAALVGPAAKWDLCAPGSDTVNAWFQTGSGTVSVDRWVQALRLNQQFYSHPFWMVEPFNEPDYPNWGEGSRQNLSDIMSALQKAPEFTGAIMAGGSTMSTDQATSWFDALGGQATAGTTHCLYGSVDNYVSFIQHAKGANAIAVNPEGHNVVEAIIGANYGLDAMIWWGTAERTRGDFVRASQGVRLGYAEDRANWTAAAVYRAVDGTVEAFLGSGERVGGTSTYTFHSTDRDVYYDGHGPMRDYTVTIARNQERVVIISPGPDPQPVVGGRYAIVNVNSGLSLDVAGASTAAAATLEQGAYNQGNSQQWTVAPLADGGTGDLSYFVLTNVNSGLNIDLPDWVYADDAVIKQYGYPANAVEHWYFQYAGNGAFYIRSRWSDKCLAVSGGARTVGAAVVQRTFSASPDELWRLQSPASIPVAGPLQISRQPQSVTGAAGQTITFAVGAAGTGRLTYQWQFNGSAIAGATDARLLLTNITSANAGNYTVVVTDALGSITSAAATLSLSTTADVGRIANLSVRSIAGTGDQTLIVGFATGGPVGKQPVLVRGIGPSLSIFGVTNPVAAPAVDLYRGSTLLQSQSAWGGAATLSATFNAVGAFGLDPASKDVAFLPTLPSGAYTALLTGNGTANGVALMELYDATPSGTFNVDTMPRLLNASGRTQVGTGENVLIAGFVIGGSTARTVLIRGIGPALGLFGLSGTLAEPRLDLVHGSTTLDTNVGWAGDAQIAAVSQSVGAFPLNNPTSTDSALLETLPPGAYSAIVSGADGGTGVGLVEVYDVP